MAVRKSTGKSAFKHQPKSHSLIREHAEYIEVPGGTVRPDARGRITLSHNVIVISEAAKLATCYRQYVDKEGNILLRPMVEIPSREQWIHQDPAVLASIREGVEQANRGVLVRGLDFSQYADEQIEED